MTKSNAQIFTELTTKDKNDVWHEVRKGSYQAVDNMLIIDYKYICSCGLVGNYKQPLEIHCKNLNPTYPNAADILNRMRDFVGEDGYIQFVIYLIIPKGMNYFTFIDQYILNPSALLEKAIEFLETP